MNREEIRKRLIEAFMPRSGTFNMSAALAEAHRAADAAMEIFEPSLDLLAEYENAITWNTSCLACSRTLDASIRDHDRAEQAEANLRQFVTDVAVTAQDYHDPERDVIAAVPFLATLDQVCLEQYGLDFVWPPAPSPPSPGAPESSSPEREVPAPAPPAADPGRSGGAGHTPRDPACGTPDCGHPRSAHNLTRTRRWTDCSVITSKTGACACVRFTDPATKEPA
jgi:hypothetical protein